MATNAERMLVTLGLERLVINKPKGKLILDPGRHDLKHIASYSMRETQPAGHAERSQFLEIYTGQWGRALQRCVPHDASEVRAVLQVITTSPPQLHDLCGHSRSESKDGPAIGQHPKWSLGNFASGLVSILKRALQHVKGVISINLVHDGLDTAVNPDWDLMRRVCSQQGGSACSAPPVLLDYMPCTQIT